MSFSPDMSDKSLLKKQAKAELLNVTAPIRNKYLNALKETLKHGLTQDPDMWKCLQRHICEAIDWLWTDVEREVERQLESAMLRKRLHADEAGPSGGRLFNIWCQFRAALLYSYLPNDKSIFGCLKDIRFWPILLMTLTPQFGIRVGIFSVILLMLLFPGPPDECQLTNFILVFKGTQFLASGVLQMCLGAFNYYSCYTFSKTTVEVCIDHNGPGASDNMGQLPDYLGSLVLVWVAFLCLSCSTRLEAVLPQGWLPHVCEEGDCVKHNHRLQGLLYYDVISFILSLVLLLVLTVLTMDWELGKFPSRPQTMENVLWCKVFYSILSLPFAFFQIPGMLTLLLTHGTITGYNKNGALVYFDLEGGGGGDNDDDEENVKGTRSLWMVTKLLRVANRGRQARGKEVDGKISPKDLARGTWERVIHGREHDATPSFVETFGPLPVTTAAHYSRALEDKMRETMKGLRSCVSGESLSLSVGLQSVNSVRILDEPEFSSGKPVYVIEVMPNPEVGQSWQVRRQYSEFVSLLNQFQLPNNHFPDAPFPRYCFTQRGEREGLNLWLLRVMEDKLCRTVCAGPLSDFLDIKQNRTSAQDIVQNLPKNFYLTSHVKDNETHCHDTLSVPLLPSPPAEH